MQAAETRRLVAVLSTDAVGYSRLMSRDDLSTYRCLKSHVALMGALIQEHCGRVVDAVGDNLLAEFPSVVDAVSCALEIQQKLALENRDLQPDRRMEFRIGVNIGDVIVDGDRMAGDGINTAARLESMAQPGGICLSGAAFEQVSGRIPMSYEDLGELSLKNISAPVRAYHVKRSSARDLAEDPDPDSRWSVPGFARQPAVAILPFRNASGDSDDGYLADGVADDLISRLASWRFVPVVDRNSSFRYANATVDVREIGRELAVRYIVAGSVRRSGRRVSISVRLSDASAAHQIWSEKYTCELDDIFEAQDEITETIIGLLVPALIRAEGSRALRKKPANLDAWDCTLRGLSHIYRTTRDDNAVARTMAERAIKSDGLFAPPLTLLAVTHLYDVFYQWTQSPRESIDAARLTAEKALALDDANPMGLTALGFVFALTGDHLRAKGSLQRAVELNPSLALAHYGLGIVAQLRGQTDRAIGMISKAIRLSPRDPMLHMFYTHLAQAHLVAERFKDAMSYAERSLEIKLDPEALRIIGASCGYLGKAERARSALDEMRKIQPQFSIQTLRSTISERLADIYTEGWRRSGWKE